MSLIQWLENQDEFPKFYWRSRDTGTEIAAVGVLEEYEQPRIGSVGFVRFDNDRSSDKLWSPFGKSRFWKPSKLQQAITPCPPALNQTEIQVKRTQPTPGWSQAVREILDVIQQDSLQKAVLARHMTLSQAEPVDSLSLLAKLQSQIPTAYHFLYEPMPGLAFLGASPEQLFKRQGSQLESEAQAGTKPRAAPADDLLKNDKELREHQWVIDDILNRFHELCIDYGVTNRHEVIKLSHVQHLRTRIRGILAPGIQDEQILKALHPTPAVCGWPREEAFKLLRQLEDFDRGFYAGAIGYAGEEDSEFAVAIRCAVIENSTLHLFGGAGIVPGSTPEHEWEEIENKIAFWRALL